MWEIVLYCATLCTHQLFLNIIIIPCHYLSISETNCLVAMQEVEQLRQEKQDIDQQLRAVQGTNLGSMQNFPVPRRSERGYNNTEVEMRSSNARGPSRGRGRGGRGNGRDSRDGGANTRYGGNYIALSAHAKFSFPTLIDVRFCCCRLARWSRCVVGQLPLARRKQHQQQLLHLGPQQQQRATKHRTWRQWRTRWRRRL